MFEGQFLLRTYAVINFINVSVTLENLRSNIPKRSFQNVSGICNNVNKTPIKSW